MKKKHKKVRKKKFHYIYKIHFLCGFPAGRYYIGKRTYCGTSIDKDSYTGSGKFCRDYFSKYSSVAGETYIKEILEINPSVDVNSYREEIWIGDLWKSDPLCMNQMPGGLCYRKMQDDGMFVHGLSTKIRQYKLDGTFVKEWDSISEAETALNINNVSACCRRLRPKAGGFVWRYSSENKNSIDPKEALAKHSRAVIQCDLQGNVIKQFDRIQDAAIELNISKKGIQECCAGRQKSASGYIWKYVDPEHTRKCNRDLKKCGAIKVSQFDLEGNFIATYESINTASRITNVNHTLIGYCCKGDYAHAGNYIWKYAE